ncbi:putative membrane protein [Alteromonadaceae bacterium 2753L.S.0a.02]|nr:putative membrane protein [Alteromonadaceae bacterium 2753L.S.0a.02]
MTQRTTKPIAHLNTKLKISLVMTYASYAALIGLFLGWNFFRDAGPNWAVFIVQAGPLLLLLPGMLKNYYRSFSWLCFLLLIYFIKAVDGVFMSTANLLDVIFLILTVVIFISAMLASRWMQRKTKDELYV